MMFRGPRRFGYFNDRLSLSEPVLSQRLSDLLDSGIIEQHLYSEHPPRYDYGLTDRGRDLWRVVVAMWSWETRWAKAGDGATPRLIHHGCGQSIQPLFGCGSCGGVARRPIATGQRRMDYRLRPKGLDMLPVFATVNAWANTWMHDSGADDLTISHSTCGNPLEPTWVYPVCNMELELGQFNFDS